MKQLTDGKQTDVFNHGKINRKQQSQKWVSFKKCMLCYAMLCSESDLHWNDSTSLLSLATSANTHLMSILSIVNTI